jgi:HK97 family phage prohead protease
MIRLNKAGQRLDDSFDFVLSTETPDRVGDIVVIGGIDTRAFEQNPMALFMHQHLEPIGRWSNLRKTATSLIGTLELAASGTSQRIDFVRELLGQGILKAVSVSLQPLEFETIDNAKPGQLIRRSDLVEVSVVTVPMNPEALLIAKNLHFSDAEIENLFESPMPSPRLTAATRAGQKTYLATLRHLKTFGEQQ